MIHRALEAAQQEVQRLGKEPGDFKKDMRDKTIRQSDNTRLAFVCGRTLVWTAQGKAVFDEEARAAITAFAESE